MSYLFSLISPFLFEVELIFLFEVEKERTMPELEGGHDNDSGLDALPNGLSKSVQAINIKDSSFHQDRHNTVSPYER